MRTEEAGGVGLDLFLQKCLWKTILKRKKLSSKIKSINSGVNAPFVRDEITRITIRLHFLILARPK